MADEDQNEMDKAVIERMVDQEFGTQFNWQEFPAFLELEKGVVTEYPDRVWVNEIMDMLKEDGQASGVELALTMPLRQANLTIEKPDGPNAARITDWVEDALMRPAADGGMSTPFELVFSQMTLASAVRRTFHELVWCRRDDGKYGLEKIAWRPPGSCELLRDRQTGDKVGFKQFLEWESAKRANVDQNGYVTIPPQRAVIHINNQHKDPLYGWSDLEAVHWAYKLKCQIFKLWLTFLDGTSLPRVAAYGKDKTEATENARQLSRLKSSGVVGVVRSGGDENQKLFDVLDMAGQGAGQFVEAIRYCDGMMSGSALAGWMDLAGAASQSGAGSYALSADQSGLFLASRHGAARELSWTVNDQIIRRLVRVNFGPKAPVPKLKVEKIGSDQVAKAMEMLATLGSAQSIQVPAGFVDLLIERVSQYLDLPDDRVRKMIEENAKAEREARAAQGDAMPAPGTPGGNLQDAVAGAVGAVQEAVAA